MAEWSSFAIQVPGKDLLEPVRDVLETLLTYLEILKAILNTIKTFLVDFGNPIKALVEALIRLIEELLRALKATGVFGYFDIPNPLKDPNFDRHFGGFEAFTSRFKGSLFDSKDFNRPQPTEGSVGGFLILMVDASSIIALIRAIKNLMRFFGKEFTSPKYAPPENVRAIPVGDDGDPILAVASIFTSNIEAIQIQWTLPTTQESPDPAFSDLVTTVAAEFVPPKFLLERADGVAPTKLLNAAVAPAGPNEMNLAVMGDPDQVGVVQIDRLTTFKIPNSLTSEVVRRETLVDTDGEPVIKFNKYKVIDVLSAPGILGQLGRFRVIDSDIELNKTYYYRVRAFSGSLAVDGLEQIQWNQLKPPGEENAEFSQQPVLRWPSTDDGEVVMGVPSGLVQAIVPKVPDPAEFDVIENLRRLFKTAFSLDFHTPPTKDVIFDALGDPVSPGDPDDIGRGSLEGVSGVASVILSGNLRIPAQGAATGYAPEGDPDPALGEVPVFPDMPWLTFAIRRQAARLADASATALLEAGQVAVDEFRLIMQGTPPAGQFDLSTPGVDIQVLEDLVFEMTDTEETVLRPAVRNPDPDEAAFDEVTVTSATISAVQLFDEAFDNASARKNVLAAINYLKNFTLGGVPVDWISIVPLRDIVPWAGTLIYDLLEAVQKLLDAFQGVLDEIRQFIELLERKIEALEKFIQFLIQILNFIESLELAAFVLNSGSVSGNVFGWIDVVDNAGGDRPPNSPGGYSAGVAFAAVGPDFPKFIEALGIIF